MSTNAEKFRTMSDFLLEHPDMDSDFAIGTLFYVNTNTLLAAARIPGAKKIYEGGYLYIDIPLGDFNIQVFISREVVCTPTKWIEEVVPATPERTIRKVISWDCHPLLSNIPDKETV